MRPACIPRAVRAIATPEKLAACAYTPLPRMLNEEERQRAVECLAAGGLVAVPTETVYGLAADAGNELAVRRIFAAKGRPSTHPLIVHLADAERLPEWARRDPRRRPATARGSGDDPAPAGPPCPGHR